MKPKFADGTCPQLGAFEVCAEHVRRFPPGALHRAGRLGGGGGEARRGVTQSVAHVTRELPGGPGVWGV